MKYNGKKVLTYNELDYKNLAVGDYVEQEIVEDAINCVPPISFSRRCSQCGEPYSMRLDTETNRWRSTYSTFVCVDSAAGVWEFRGHCFAGETTERGEEPAYIGG